MTSENRASLGPYTIAEYRHGDAVAFSIVADGVPLGTVYALKGDPGRTRQRANVSLLAASWDLREALEMVRDADNDCRADGLRTMPPIVRAKIDAALAKAGGRDR
ncbi:MAG: hypothetical protein EA385_15270 [Salinarimonadaceae bacterium]|nr:MAG: hypothetical protein EA385_15270 [Salinarimonadaceae bacterium]